MKAKRLLALVLCLVMMMSIIPMTVVAQEDEATEAAPSIHDVLKVGADYSTVYYGGIPWRVLSKDYSANTADADAKKGILLLSEHAMANGIQYNAHYSNGAWSADNPIWASAMVMPWNDPRHPDYEYNIANNHKNDDSSGGYLTSDIRAYLTGEGEFEAFRPYAYYNESWGATGTTLPDRNGQGWRYYERKVVTETAPLDGVTYYVKGEFELSDHNRASAKVGNVTVPGMVAITINDWAENTWYTMGRDGLTLMTEWPAGVTTVNAYYDQAPYYQANVSNGFEDGVTYYTFERYLSNDCPKNVVNGVEYAMGEHLAGLFKWVGYTVPDLGVSDHNDALTDTTHVAGLAASEKNLASDLGLSAAELDAVLLTSGHGYNRGSGFNGGWSSNIGSTFGDRLENDSFFLLSGEEVKVYLTNAGHIAPATFFDGTAAGDLWTRSWGRADIQTIVTYAHNAVNWYKGANTWWQAIRPAFNLDPDAVVLYDAVPGKANTYTMTLKDAARAFAISEAERAGDLLNVTYSGAVVGENEYFTYVLKNKTTGAIVKHAVLTAVTAESGTVAFDISAIDTLNYDFYLMNEQVNGELETNYAGEMIKVEYELSNYNLGITTDKTAMKAGEAIAATVSIDSAFYAAEYTFTYDTAKFACGADIDGDGVIYVTNLFEGRAGALATYTLIAKDAVDAATVSTCFSVEGRFVEYKEQLVSNLENTVFGADADVQVSLNYTLAIKADYVPGCSLVLVQGDAAGYAYGGAKMFYVAAYDAYAYLVEGAVTAADVDAAISKATGCETIALSYDVNAEYIADGAVDLKDATAVYACTMVDFDVAEYVELYLRADVNGDGIVNIVDINAVTRNYTE